MEQIFLFVTSHMKIIELIVFWYPVCMGLLWVVGGMIYYFRLERKKEPLPLPSTPMVSVIVPAYNESDNLYNTIDKLDQLNYPNYEIIIINDGSKDDTSIIAHKLAKKYKRVRFVDLKENCGKANALYLGYIASKGEYLVCVDGDSYLDKDCIGYLMSHFLNPANGERVGAVTGNPRVRNRSSLLAKLQLCEYASIISLIKRTQRIWGKVMTVSGVIVAYRKQALLDCGLWDRDMITEDIGVTWKLEKNFWDIRYEPRAICWMLVPETLKGIFKQRKRWAQGGQEVMFRHIGIFKSWRRRRLYPVFCEQLMSLTWMILWCLLTITEIFKLCYGAGSYIPYLWKSQFLAIICLIQFTVALFLEKPYDKGIFKYMISAAWYPLVYWIVNGIVAVLALPDTIRSRNKKLATWNSPDRGIATADNPQDLLFEAETAAEDEIIDNHSGIIDEDGIDLNSNVIPLIRFENYKKDDKKEVSQDANVEGNKKASKNQEDENIISGKQKTWKKVIELIVCLAAWAFVLVYLIYLVYGYICLKTNHTPIEIFIYNENVLFETQKLLMITLTVFLCEVVFMLFWKEYNRLRFGKLRRRTFKPDVSVEQMAAFFGQSEDDINLMRLKKEIVLEKNIIPEDFKAERKELFGKKQAELKALEEAAKQKAELEKEQSNENSSIVTANSGVSDNKDAEEREYIAHISNAYTSEEKEITIKVAN